jgi:hypothetical protein
MTRTITCSECSSTYRLPDGAKAQRATCKKCGATIAIAAPRPAPIVPPVSKLPPRSKRVAPKKPFWSSPIGIVALLALVGAAAAALLVGPGTRSTATDASAHAKSASSSSGGD